MSSGTDLETGLGTRDLPGIYQAASDSSVAGQASYVRWTRARLVLVVVAALAGVLGATVDLSGSKIDIFALIAIVCFLLALAAEIILLASRPEEIWYYGRAVAESAKTLAWRYAMHALPFKGVINQEADKLMLSRMAEAIRDSPIAGELQPQAGGYVTAGMRSLRHADFPTRKQAYLVGRVDDQISWYTTKANYNRVHARFWRVAMLALEVGGAFAALLVLIRVTSVSVDGVLASIIASAGAWLEVRQFENLASAYNLTATELSLARAEGEAVSAEEGWPDYVGATEDAISREHTMWLVRRVKPRLGRV